MSAPAAAAVSSTCYVVCKIDREVFQDHTWLAVGPAFTDREAALVWCLNANTELVCKDKTRTRLSIQWAVFPRKLNPAYDDLSFCVQGLTPNDIAR